MREDEKNPAAKKKGRQHLITIFAVQIRRSRESGSVTLTSCTVMRGRPALSSIPCSTRLVPAHFCGCCCSCCCCEGHEGRESIGTKEKKERRKTNDDL